MTNIKQLAMAHKGITAIILVAIAWGAYAAYGALTQTPSVTKYVIQDATQNTIVSSVAGSGQVQAASTVAVNAKVTEPVTRVAVKPGDHVVAGQLLVQLDTTNEAKALHQAELNVQSAQIALDKLNIIATSTVLQNQSNVTTAQQNLVNASTTLEKDYQTGFDTVATSFIDLQSLMTNLQNFVIGTQVDKSHSNPDAYVDIMPTYLQATTIPYRNTVMAEFTGATKSYQDASTAYHAVNRNADQSVLDGLFAQSYAASKTVGDAIKSVKDLLDYVVNSYPTGQGLASLPAITTTDQTSFGSYTTTVTSDISNILNTINTIAKDKQAMINAQTALTQANQSLTDLTNGPDPLDVKSQGISIENAQIALQTAQQNLAYDSIRAPIDGVVASVPSVVGQNVPSPAVSIVSNGQLAQITLNEVDAAKVNLGDKATLSFDAMSGLSLAGTVTEIDPVGTVSQGVVNYNVQINFVQPATTSTSQTVKPGMSVTTNIVTKVAQDVVAVPNSAIHTQGGASYVLAPATAVTSADLQLSANVGILLPQGTKMVTVTKGISNSTMTEITSGLNAGDQYIAQTITTSASTASTASGGTSALRATGAGALLGGGGGGGGAGGVLIGGTGGGAGGAAAGR
jgi:multidrug efflux pump subunit AcrA (membrane-fusion protein)